MKRLIAYFAAFLASIPLLSSPISAEGLAIINEGIFEAYNRAQHTVNYYSRVESGEEFYSGKHDTYDFNISDYDIRRNHSGDHIDDMYYSYDSFYRAEENVQYTASRAEGTIVVDGMRHEFSLHSSRRTEDILVFTDYTVNMDIAVDIPEVDLIMIDGVEYNLSPIDYPVDIEDIEGAREAYDMLLDKVGEKYPEILEKENLSYEDEKLSFSIESFRSELFPTSYYLRGRADGHEIVETFAIDSDGEYYGYTMIDNVFVN